jgi:hypothetical protein
VLVDAIPFGVLKEFRNPICFVGLWGPSASTGVPMPEATFDLNYCLVFRHYYIGTPWQAAHM